jgi:3-oxoacyl-[acyl-carrier-protein] synthase II
MLFPATSLPSSPPRVVITGAGIVTALGIGWKANAEGFRSGKSAFRQVSQFDVSRQRVKTAAEVDLPAPVPRGNLSAGQMSRLDRAGAMLMLAAQEAWRQAQWQSVDDLPLIFGTTAGGMVLGEAYFRQATQFPSRHHRQASRVVYYQPQAQARMVLDALGSDGSITIISNACASGCDAIGQAWSLIRRGQTQYVMAGGYDSLSELVFSGFAALQSLSPTACRPFDAKRDGLALGEGAAVVTLETLERAKRRGATILAEVIGYGTSIDQHHLTQPHPQGNTALAVMTQASAVARVAPEDIDYINAHGTGTPLNDISEALAINHWAGARAATLPVSSTKASIGHLLGGAGAAGAVVCLMALREQWLPAQAVFETPDPACGFPIVHEPQDASVNVTLSNAFGFGGVNASLIMKRWA